MLGCSQHPTRIYGAFRCAVCAGRRGARGARVARGGGWAGAPRPTRRRRITKELEIIPEATRAAGAAHPIPSRPHPTPGSRAPPTRPRAVIARAVPCSVLARRRTRTHPHTHAQHMYTGAGLTLRGPYGRWLHLALALRALYLALAHTSAGFTARAHIHVYVCVCERVCASRLTHAAAFPHGAWPGGGVSSGPRAPPVGSLGGRKSARAGGGSTGRNEGAVLACGRCVGCAVAGRWRVRVAPRLCTARAEGAGVETRTLALGLGGGGDIPPP